MNLPLLLFFGIVSTVWAVYKIPDHDNCVLKVLLCDNFIKPLTPVDNSTIEMFESIGELNAVCDELSKFRICLKDAEIFCKENFRLDLGFELLNIRHLAFDLCVRGSSHQHVYMMVEGCVNKYSHSAIKFCTDKAVETVGLNFYLGDYESECRFLGTIQHCHIAVVTDQCGSIAGNMLQKLVVFRGQRDWMCIGYEKERLKDLEAHYARMDSYVQQYRDIVKLTKTEDEAERNDMLNLKTPPQEASSRFHSRISLIPDDILVADIEYANNRGYLFNLKISHCTEKRPLCSCLADHKLLDSQYMSVNTARHTKRFYEQRTGKVLSDETFACKMQASFLLIGIGPNGEYYQLGYGEADVLWAKFSSLKDISCSWVLNTSEPIALTKCLILLSKPRMGRKGYKKMQYDLPCNATIAVYEAVKERITKRVAELRVRNFEYCSTLESSSEKLINFYKNYEHDIRFLCAEQLQDNIKIKPNRVHSTTRVGFIPYDDNEFNMVSGHSKISDQKYHFYDPEKLDYPIDTEIHLISSGEGNHENEFGGGDSYASQNYDETLNPFLNYKFSGKKVNRPSATPPKSSSHSYRPYELYRPRVGETLEAEHHDTSSKDLRIKNAEEICFNPQELSFEDDSENGYANHLHAEEMCPIQPENISKLVNKPGMYSRINYVNIADPLDIVESKLNKFLISEEGKDISPSNIWKAEEPEHIAAENKQNQHEEIYVVTPSIKIKTSSVPNQAVSEDVQNPDENSQLLDNEDGSQQDFVEVPQENNSEDLTLEKDFITRTINTESSKVSTLELNSNYQNDEHPFSDEYIDATTNIEVASEEKLSPKSEIFSRSGHTYATENEEKIHNAFEILAKIQLDVRRMRKIIRETETEIEMEKKITSMRTIEL